MVKENYCLEDVETKDLCAEIGRRYSVEHGKIQLTFHAGKPSEILNLDIKVSTRNGLVEKKLKVIGRYDRPALNIKL